MPVYSVKWIMGEVSCSGEHGTTVVGRTNRCKVKVARVNVLQPLRCSASNNDVFDVPLGLLVIEAVVIGRRAPQNHSWKDAFKDH